MSDRFSLVTPATDSMFFGRQSELDWLFERFRNGRTPIVITGLRGVGKTSLLSRFLGSIRVSQNPLVLNARYPSEDSIREISEQINDAHRTGKLPEVLAIDDADFFDEKQLNSIVDQAMKLGHVRTTIFVTSSAPKMMNAEILNIQPFSFSEAQALLQHLLGKQVSSEYISRAIDAASGVPQALLMLGELMRGRDHQEMQRLIQGEIYDLKRQVFVPERKLITEVKPRIISTTEALVELLRREPESIYKLPPRKFEEVIAELLTDLGYETELTPTTRDGGRDILAYIGTPHGKILCLVEAKRYRSDRKIGVELVRQLFGTLTDANASSAMLVTTSSFSTDAEKFQQRHEYKLALRDYGDVMKWVQGYKKYGSSR